MSKNTDILWTSNWLQIPQPRCTKAPKVAFCLTVWKEPIWAWCTPEKEKKSPEMFTMKTTWLAGKKLKVSQYPFCRNVLMQFSLEVIEMQSSTDIRISLDRLIWIIFSKMAQLSAEIGMTTSSDFGAIWTFGFRCSTVYSKYKFIFPGASVIKITFVNYKLF